jgi:hypothetical protein
MNKAELRKLLSELQTARAKVDVWPEDFPREGTGAGVPNSYSPDEEAALTASSPFASSLNSFHKLCLKTSFLPAEDQIQTVMEIASKQFVGKIPLHFVGQYLLMSQPQFTTLHYRLARAVQPMGKKLDPLAATIGAIRLNDKVCGVDAAQHLSATIIKAFQVNDKNTLARIRRLSSTELRNHRNFQIWLTIEEMLKKQSVKPPEEVPQSMDFPMPTTSEIRRYVENHPGKTSFDDLPKPKDHKGWTRLWQDSGASMVIRKGVRGAKG